MFMFVLFSQCSLLSRMFCLVYTHFYCHLLHFIITIVTIIFSVSSRDSVMIFIWNLWSENSCLILWIFLPVYVFPSSWPSICCVCDKIWWEISRIISLDKKTFLLNIWKWDVFYGLVVFLVMSRYCGRKVVTQPRAPSLRPVSVLNLGFVALSVHRPANMTYILCIFQFKM